MLDKQTQNISEFMGNYYSDSFRGNNTKTQKNKPFVIEFSYYVIVKYLVVSTILSIVFYLISRFRYLSPFLFFVSWLLFFNGLVWLVVIFIFFLLFYEMISIRRIRNSKIYRKEKMRLDKIFR